MATRWEKLRSLLTPLINKEKIDPSDIPTLERITSLEFNCSVCKYFDKEHGKFLCDVSKNSSNCREGYANYLNSDMEVIKNEG